MSKQNFLLLSISTPRSKNRNRSSQTEISHLQPNLHCFGRKSPDPQCPQRHCEWRKRAAIKASFAAYSSSPIDPRFLVFPPFFPSLRRRVLHRLLHLPPLLPSLCLLLLRETLSGDDMSPRSRWLWHGGGPALLVDAGQGSCDHQVVRMRCGEIAMES